MEAIAPAHQSAKVIAPEHAGDLRPAVLAGPDQLSQSARAKIIELSGPRPIRFLTEMFLNWAVIAALIALGIWADNLVVTILCIIGIGTRQMVFGLLMHEQVHRLGARSRFADWWINVFAVYPLLVTTVEDYAAVHLSHHKYFFTDKDPDFVRKSGPDWSIPTSLRSFLWIVLKDLTGINTLGLIRGKTAPKDVTEFRRRNPTPKLLRWIFFAAVALALTLANAWTVFLVYWVVPLLTVTQLFVRWIAVIEHKYNVPNATVHSVTPLIRLKWWQKILLPDFNFAQHVYHHMHPGVSFANLPAVHAIYKAEGLVDETAIFNGQGSFLRYLVKRKAG
ncbi:fatty acid desaturase [Aquincola sp. S2]|uniref:Fatty acid desaturase n=1 Tax=Pseudaquabacterium terrae TaxID=2732868 RepID=A0ABX2ERY5_9BURK|nr:fatty acid desaturase [Aquabacterium terrae]NRF71363.1 fatty acid desaturase [Aquabacterium terrae]